MFCFQRSQYPFFRWMLVFLQTILSIARRLFLSLPALLLLLVPSNGLAQQVDDARAKGLYSQLRCVVCQNQSILDSDADVARDLRQIVREQIAAGRTDDEIRTFLVARYGEFILLKPLFRWHTALLWLAPFLLLGAGALVAWRSIAKRRQGIASQTLSAEEERRIAILLERDEKHDPGAPG